MLSSLYKSAVWEEIAGRESIFIISILNKAKADGIEVLMHMFLSPDYKIGYKILERRNTD